MIEAVREMVQGVQVSAPGGKIGVALELLRTLKSQRAVGAKGEA
jgi:hypothetical protein